MKNLNILPALLSVLVLQMACEKTSRQSGVKDFATFGSGTTLTVEQLPFLSVLKNPMSVVGTAEEGVTSLWAGYTDDQNYWGQTDADCTKKGNEVYCVKNNDFLFASTKQINMGMETPLQFPVSINAAYALMQVSRSLKLSSGLSDNSQTHSEKVTIEKFDGVTSTIASTKRTEKDIYKIKTASTNKLTNLGLEVVYYIKGNGHLMGVAVRQEQNYNGQTQIQTAEWHLPVAGQGKSPLATTFPIAID